MEVPEKSKAVPGNLVDGVQQMGFVDKAAEHRILLDDQDAERTLSGRHDLQRTDHLSVARNLEYGRIKRLVSGEGRPYWEILFGICAWKFWT